MMTNNQMIAEIGLDAFLEQQAKRITFLEEALKHHNNGRNKSFFCLAAALLSIDSLNKVLALAGTNKNLRTLLNDFAKDEGIEL
jgi:hypothetical protein